MSEPSITCPSVSVSAAAFFLMMEHIRISLWRCQIKKLRKMLWCNFGLRILTALLADFDSHRSPDMDSHRSPDLIGGGRGGRRGAGAGGPGAGGRSESEKRGGRPGGGGARSRVIGGGPGKTWARPGGAVETGD